MLDESMFEDIHEIAENSAYLKAVEDKDVSLEMLEQLPPYEELRGLEEKLRLENKLTFDAIFNEPTGYYCIKIFLIADYAVDKAIFIKDVEAYRSMRFESARRKVASLLYQRFVATDEPSQADFKPGSSVFQIIQSHKGMDEKGVVSSGPKGIEKSDNKSDKMEKTVVSTNLPSQSNMTQMSATTGHGMHGLHGGHGVNGVDEYGMGMHGRSRNESTFQMGTNNNPIGVYGKSIRIVKERVMRGEAPKDLFDDVARDVMTDLKLDVFPRFQKSEFYRKYIRTKWIETQKVTVKDFTTFRVLGRGGFGAVHACRKKNSGQIYAMKCFPESDTRILTNEGFMFLNEIERKVSEGKGEQLKYAAFDVASQSLVYVPGQLVLPRGEQHNLINITAPTEQRRWDQSSNQYGQYLKENEEQSIVDNHLSVRVTPDHHLYAQVGNPQLMTNKAESFDKMDASTLLHNHECPNRSSHVRMQGVAANGVAHSLAGEVSIEATLRAELGLHAREEIDAFMQLYGYWMKNGTLNYEDVNCIQFEQVCPDNIEWVQTQLLRAGLVEGCDWQRLDTMIRIMNPLWFAFFDKEYGIQYPSSQYYAPSKLSSISSSILSSSLAVSQYRWFSSWVLTHLPATHLRRIIGGLQRANGQTNAIVTSSIRLRDELLVVLMHAGYSAHFDMDTSSPSESWRVRYTDSAQPSSYPTVPCESAISKEQYTGRIWCVTVAHPDHLIVAQRASRQPNTNVVTKVSQPIIIGQCINKKLVKVKSALDNVLEERNVLTMMKSNFVTNLKYALQDEDTLYLIMDLMLGGDLKFHLINAGRFTEKRARFYAAQVLLGLEHVHNASIIYRDMKLENVLIDGSGHCRLSDLGLAVVTKVKIKGYAGTPGYCFPAADHQLMTKSGFMFLNEIEQHFAHQPTLDIACWVDGQLQFHSITKDNLTVEEVDTDLIHFTRTDSNISLTATAGHRMFGRFGLGESSNAKSAVSWQPVNGDASPPPRAIHSARDLYNAGQQNMNAVYQMSTAFTDGYAGDGMRPIYMDALGLESEDEGKAFLWLYGYLLANGSIDETSGQITIGSVQFNQAEMVENVFARLPTLDYVSQTHPIDGSRQYIITSSLLSDFILSSSPSSLQLYSHWVWQLGRDSLRTILSGQSSSQSKIAGESLTHYGAIRTSSIVHRDEMLRLSIFAGYSSNFSATPSGEWEVTFTDRVTETDPDLLAHHDISMQPAVHTKVWCVTVPAKDNLIMFRRVLASDKMTGSVTEASRPVIVGNTAPEMIKNKLYGPAADIFSYGVMIYRMLCGSKPFKGKVDRDLDKAVIERKPQFPKEIFSKEAISLLTGLLQKRPENRLGCTEKGIEDIKEHPFFESIDFGLLEAGYIDPPFVPNKFDVNAASLKDIGDFDRAKYKHVKLDDRFKQRIKNFEYVSAKALQDEMVLVLEKADENVNFEKFAHQPQKQEQTQPVANGPCCTIV